MNKLKCLLVVAISAIAFAGCRSLVDVEYCYGAKVIIENKSSKDIKLDNSVNTMSNSAGIEHLDITLAPGESYSFTRSGDSPGFAPASYIGNKCRVTFGDAVSVIHYDGFDNFEYLIEHSICCEGSFQTETHQRNYTYTFTFTDADYDRAVEWNAKYGATHAAQ